MSSSTTLSITDVVTLTIRPAVVSRVHSFRGGELVYLSLYDDEVDDRCGQYLEDFIAGADHPSVVERCLHIPLELTDVVVVCDHGSYTHVARGASATVPLYWRRDSQNLALSTRLPIEAGSALSAEGLAVNATTVCLPGTFEPMGQIETPLAGWSRCRRGVVTSIDRDGILSERTIRIEPTIALAGLSYRAVETQVRDAFLAYGRSQRRVRAAVVELSGGYDSTLAAALTSVPKALMHGVSFEFPYYEFRFEAPLQNAVAQTLNIERLALDGMGALPFAPWSQPPRFDEPTAFVTGIRHAEIVSGYGEKCRADKIYTGHGGDHLFTLDLTQTETLSPSLDRGAFLPAAWRSIQGSLRNLTGPRWRERRNGLFVYDAGRDPWIKETFGASLRTPFTDLSVFRSAQLWSHWNSTRGSQPDKSILATALSDFLPEPVVRRTGKAAYDGVWVRSYSQHASHIGETLERAAPFLSRIGYSMKWLRRRLKDLEQWRPVSQLEIISAYATAVWLLSWGSLGQLEFVPD
jgi:hypothetical protein